MKYTLVGELPRHIYCYVSSTFTHREPQGVIPCVWFGLVSYPGRIWGCTVMLECGAIYRNVPVHAMSFVPEPARPWSPYEAQTWDCYGEEFTLLEYNYLSGLQCKAKTKHGDFVGEYLFTAAPIGDGFSAVPEQAKEFCFIKLEIGRLTVQPTDKVVFSEPSFTKGNMEFPSGLARQNYIFSTEK